MTYLKEFDADRKSLVEGISKQLGYQLDPSDIELFIPMNNHVRVRSVCGVFFFDGKPQNSPWGTKESLPKEFKMPEKNTQIVINDYTVDFDPGFYS